MFDREICKAIDECEGIDIANHDLLLPSPVPTYHSQSTTELGLGGERHEAKKSMISRNVTGTQIEIGDEFEPQTPISHFDPISLNLLEPPIDRRRYARRIRSWWMLISELWVYRLLLLVSTMVMVSVLITGKQRHSISLCPLLNSSSSKLSPGDLLNPVPPVEHLIPDLYRSNWSSSKNMISKLDYDLIEPIDPQNGKGSGWTIVFIHGLGAPNASHAYQWRESLLSTLHRPPNYEPIGNLTGLRFLFPKAPIMPITVYGHEPRGGERPGWFDIKDWRDLNYLEDEEGLRESCILISNILHEQIRTSKMDLNKTIIAGFSQGKSSAFEMIIGSLSIFQSTLDCLLMNAITQAWVLKYLDRLFFFLLWFQSFVGAVMALLLSLSLFEPPAATLLLVSYLH